MIETIPQKGIGLFLLLGVPPASPQASPSKDSQRGIGIPADDPSIRLQDIKRAIIPPLGNYWIIGKMPMPRVPMVQNT